MTNNLERRIDALEKGPGGACTGCGCIPGELYYHAAPPMVEVTATGPRKPPYRLVEISDGPSWYYPEDAARIDQVALRPCPICGAKPKLAYIAIVLPAED